MTGTGAHVLVVDDDENIGELVRLYLAREGFQMTHARDGEEALRLFSTRPPDLIILDVMLPGLDGWEVCRRVRASSRVPIIMLSAKGERFDRILGLELGADDYLVKPFDPYELVARVKAVMRRSATPGAGPAAAAAGAAAGSPGVPAAAAAGAAPGAPPAAGVGGAAPGATAVPAPAAPGPAGSVPGERVSWGALVVDRAGWTAFLDGRELQLTRKELELLHYLASHPNRAFTRDQLLEQVWGYDFAGESRTVDAHIKRLRQKLGGEGQGWRIATVWGVGYRFEVR